jgi:hypothetical protein
VFVLQVNALIESFLLQERTIILCVIPSNQDIATVDILERAQKVSSYTAACFDVSSNVVMYSLHAA